MGSEWMMLCQFSFSFHSPGPDFTECVYVWVRGDTPQIPSSASDLFMIMQESPNLSDSDSSHLPYLSKCLGEFNQIKLKEPIDLLWRYHLASKPLHLPNNNNKVWALSWASSKVQDVDDRREARLQPVLRVHASPNTRIKCTLGSCHLHLCHSSKKTNCSGEVSE